MSDLFSVDIQRKEDQVQYTARAHKRRGERACNFQQEHIGPVVQAKSLGHTKNSEAVQWFPVTVDVK